MRGLTDRLLADRVLVGDSDIPADPYVHLRAGDVSSSPVDLWPDYSGNNRDFVQATAGNQPMLTANAANGRAAVTFDGSDDVLAHTLVSEISVPYTVVAVIRLAGGSGNRHFFGAGGSAVSIGVETPGVFMAYAGSLLESSVSADANWHLYMVVINGSFARIRIDGTTDTGNSGTRGLGSSLRVGAFNTASNPWPGDVAELLVYDRDLSPVDEVKLLNLAMTYGIDV